MAFRSLQHFIPESLPASCPGGPPTERQAYCSKACACAVPFLSLVTSGFSSHWEGRPQSQNPQSSAGARNLIKVSFSCKLTFSHAHRPFFPMETFTFLVQESKPWPGQRRRRQEKSESQARGSWVEMKDSAHDTPLASFGTQQALLVFDDKILGGHTAEEADMGVRKTTPSLGPSGERSTARPLCLSPLMSVEVSASPLPAFCPVPALLPCPVPPLPFAQEDQSTRVAQLSPSLC